MQPALDRDPLGDPEPGQPDDHRHRVPDDEHGVAAEDFTAANGYQVTPRRRGRPQRRSTSYFVRVPAGTPALKVDLQGGGTAPGAGQIRFLRYHPYGVPIEDTSIAELLQPAGAAGQRVRRGQPDQPHVRPTRSPGVWEIMVEARRTSDTASAPYTLTASVLGATVSPEPGHHRVRRGSRHADRAAVHADELVRPVHRPGRSARTWAARRSTGRRSRTAHLQQIQITVTRGCDAAAGQDRQHVRPAAPTSTWRCTTAPAAPACWPRRARTATPRRRSRCQPGGGRVDALVDGFGGAGGHDGVRLPGRVHRLRRSARSQVTDANAARAAVRRGR